MAKKRKTREQKKLADLRHNFTHTLVKNTISEANVKLPNKTDKPSETKIILKTASNEYPYLMKDLSKTAMLTAAMLTLQFLLFFLIKNHVVNIPGLIY
jgi:hypothetical protein